MEILSELLEEIYLLNESEREELLRAWIARTLH
jgi:hypothetical protein